MTAAIQLPFYSVKLITTIKSFIVQGSLAFYLWYQVPMKRWGRELLLNGKAQYSWPPCLYQMIFFKCNYYLLIHRTSYL